MLQSNKTSHLMIKAGSFSALILFWAFTSFILNDADILPSPFEVVPLIFSEISKGELPHHLFATLTRVLWAFLLAMCLGGIIGYLLGRNTKLNEWLDPWLIVFLNLPALVLIVLCYLWIGLNEIAAITAVVLNKVPTVAAIMREGARSMRRDLDDLSHVYKFSWNARLRHIILPQLAPSITAAARTGLSLIWKIVLVVEFLGRSSGIGFKIHLYFQQFNVSMVLVYSLSFVIVMLIVEILFLQPWEARVRRWRSL